MSQKTKKLIIQYLPYVLVGLVATNLGEAWRLATGSTAGEKILSLMYTVPQAFGNPLPSLHPFDLLIGLLCGGGLRLAVYLKGKNAKKYRHNMEYGSARWGTAKDIEPFMAPKFEDNIHDNKFGKGVWMKLPEDGETKVSRPVLQGQDETGKNVWSRESRMVPNTELKSMLEAYKEKSRDSVLSDLSSKQTTAAQTAHTAPKRAARNKDASR